MDGFFHDISALVLDVDGDEAAKAIKGALDPLDSSWDNIRDSTSGLAACLISCSRAGPDPMWSLMRTAWHGLEEMSKGVTDSVRGSSATASANRGSRNAVYAMSAAKRMATPFAVAMMRDMPDMLSFVWFSHLEILSGCAMVMFSILSGSSARYFTMILADMQDEKCQQLGFDLKEGPLTLNSSSMRICTEWASKATSKWEALIKGGYSEDAAARIVEYHLPPPWAPKPE
jgi:hypothetical protein